MARARLVTPPRPLLGLAALEVAVVGAIAARYGADGAPSTVAALVLAPVAVAATWLIGRRLGGPRLAAAAAAVYVLLPALASIYMLSTYRSTFTHTALPDLVGLHGTPWFVLGLAIALVATVRRLGPVLFVAGVTWFALSWGDLGAIRSGLHETAWSIALLEWLVLAGIVGAGRRSLLRSAGLAGWLGFAIGHAAGRGYDGVAFWQSLSIAAPAIAVLLSSLGLLVPRLRPAPAARPADAP